MCSRSTRPAYRGEPYAYALNSPFAYTDPSGLFWDELASAGMFVSEAAAGVLNGSFKRGDDWVRGPAHIESATGRRYRPGISIEEVFERGDDYLVRHRVYGPGDSLGHETFRDYTKFGAP